MRLRVHLLAQGLVALCIGSFLAGCNILAIPLMAAHVMGYGDEANIQFRFPKDARRVAVVVNLTRHHQVDVGHFDRDVSNWLAPKIADYTKGKPEIIRAHNVHKWMDENPSWKSAVEAGRGLNADHVVFVEIRDVSFYEKEGWTNMYKGRAECTVTVYRLGSEVDEAEPIWGPKNSTHRFPNGLRPIPSSDLSVSQFREAFVRHTAERLSWIFVPHDSSLEYGDDHGH
jgi:hypothetical protein